jgi:hypothetical protein
MLFVFNFWPKVEDPKNWAFGLELLVSKVGDEELGVLGLQLSMPKVED